MKEHTPQKKIIIIGAGIAGLAACEKLTELGYNAMILEARNRYGGRIWTDNSLGIPFGKGAGWIHGNHNNPMTDLAKCSNTEMVVVDPNKFVIFNQKGLSVKPIDVQNFNVKFDMLLKQAKKLAYDDKVDISLSSALNHLMQTTKISDLEKILFKNKLHAIENYMGADSSNLSARTYNDAEEWPGENCFLTTSYQSIIEALAKKCRIQLSTLVKKINLREKNIEIVTDNSTFYADCVVVTLPLGALQKNIISFTPHLPNSKLKAIQSLGMGLFNITAIKFPRIFWPNEPHALFFTQFDTLSTSVFFNLAHFISQPILVGYTGGQTALELENFSDDQIINKIMTNFKKHFTASLPDPDSFITTRWSQDPLSYGSYSYFKTGSTSEDYAAIAEPVDNRLFFAGEATCSKYPATTHGAFLSGIREAERINKIFHKN